MRLKRGQIVCVKFADHVQGGTEPLHFMVYGRLANIRPDTLTICGWEYDPPRPECPAHLLDTNRTTWVILRSAITEVQQLRRV